MAFPVERKNAINLSVLSVVCLFSLTDLPCSRVTYHYISFVYRSVMTKENMPYSRVASLIGKKPATS